nr:immunoglobulin heavy chain junction region [Mus musculus]
CARRGITTVPRDYAMDYW